MMRKFTAEMTLDDQETIYPMVTLPDDASAETVILWQHNRAVYGQQGGFATGVCQHHAGFVLGKVDAIGWSHRKPGR